MKKPLIAVICYAPNDENHYYLPKFYISALRGSGAIPLIIPPGEADLPALYDAVQGVMFAGGGDIDPSFYRKSGAVNHGANNIYGVSKERDLSELELMALAVKGKKPVLAICRGLQLLNIYLGGSLYEDLPPSQVQHRETQKKGIEHPVRIKKGRIIDQLGLSSINGLSWHHQAADKLGAGLNAVAFADDGVVEACEFEEHPWFLAVQWHPEMTVDEDPDQQKIFRIFVTEAAKEI